MRRGLLFSFLLLLGCLTAARAQDADDDEASLPKFTLKVYANLAQVPTLVLDSHSRPVLGLPRTAFGISIDSGPLFAPTQMRTEGDDPISLTVLLDASSSDNKHLLDRFASAFAQLAPTFLHPTDTVSVYALDCKLIRTALDVPVSQTHLDQRVNLALNEPRLHDGSTRPACTDKVAFWDSVVRAAAPLGQSTSRRVLLIVSAGYDGGSTISPAIASLSAGRAGAAVFAIRAFHATPDDFRPHGMEPPSDPLDRLCQSNGGRVFSTIPNELSTTLQKLLIMLRSRYIVEFPRPDDTTGGLHELSVTVPHHNYEVHHIGVTMPLPDPALAHDPTVLHSSPSPAKVGTRRPMMPQ